MRYRLLQDHWFLIGVFVITAVALGNPGGFVQNTGKTLGRFHASELGIILIFIFSGLELKRDHLMEAIRDWPGTCLSLGAIFILAPLLAWLLSHATSLNEIQTGLFLISVVPTTLATSTVMSGAAGGRVAHALLITILANTLCIVTIPGQLSLMIREDSLSIKLPHLKMTMKLAGLVLLPLLAGMMLRKPLERSLSHLSFRLSVLSQCIILLMIFLGLSEGRDSILNDGGKVGVALGLVILLHFSLSAILWTIIRGLQWGPGRRESVFFTGIQKTLPLSIWLQTTYFPAYGMALVVCVFYHIVQLMVDSYFVGRLSSARK